jgi:ABC-type transport system substrate-binding protein
MPSLIAARRRASNGQDPGPRRHLTIAQGRGPVSLPCILVLAMLFPTPEPAHAQSVQFVAHPAFSAPLPTAGTPRCKVRNRASGTVIYGDFRFPQTLNPLQGTGVIDAQAGTPLFDQFFEYNNRARLVPMQATTVPTVKNGGIRDGGKTIVLNLKKGMRWSNGAEITSADVRFGWQVVMDQITGPLCAGTCDVIKRIETPDRYTAILRLKRIYAPALTYAIPQLWPVRWPGAWNGDPHKAALTLEKSTYSFEGSGYPTSGPYEVESFVKDDRITYRPMKWYTTMSCGARVKTLIFEFFSSKAGLIAAAANRQVDVSGGFSLAELSALKSHAGAYTISEIPAFVFERVEFNVDPTYAGKPNPLANVNVRLALALALDKIGMIRSALGLSTKGARALAAWTPLVNTPTLVQPFADKSITGQWDPLAHAYVLPGGGRALRDARTLLGRTPWKGGFSIDFVTLPDPVRLAALDVVAANWSRLGVTVQHTIDPSGKLFGTWEEGGTLARGQFQAVMFSDFNAPDPDAWKFLLESRYIDRSAAHHGNINKNDSGIRDTVIDRAMEAGDQSLDHKVRTTSYAIMQRRVNSRAYWIGLYFRPIITTNSSRVRGFANNPIAGPFWNVYDWQIAKHG